MGWSCSKAAMEVMDTVSAACLAQTGSSNVWETNGERYFYEFTGLTEYADGRICCQIYHFLATTLCKPAGSIRIEGSGKITRIPDSLRELVLTHLLGKEQGNV